MIYDYHVIATLSPTELLRNKYKIPLYWEFLKINKKCNIKEKATKLGQWPKW